MAVINFQILDDDDDRWAFFRAIKKGDITFYLDDLPRLIKMKDARGNTALHMAAIAGRENIIKILIENGANIRATNNCGSTPLRVASPKLDAVIKDLLNPKNYAFWQKKLNVKAIVKKREEEIRSFFEGPVSFFSFIRCSVCTPPKDKSIINTNVVNIIVGYTKEP